MPRTYPEVKAMKQLLVRLELDAWDGLDAIRARTGEGKAEVVNRLIREEVSRLGLAREGER